MRLKQCYVCALVNAVLFVAWIVTLERFGCFEAANYSREDQQQRGKAKRAQLQKDLVNSSDLLRPVPTSKRPLLVRFDWYSRKHTPVHIGYVGCIADNYMQ